MEKLLEGDHPVLVRLWAQASKARLASRENTGVGFHCTFEVPPDVPLVTPADFELWVPVLDFALVMESVARERLERKHEAEFDFTESEGTIVDLSSTHPRLRSNATIRNLMEDAI